MNKATWNATRIATDNATRIAIDKELEDEYN
jgi:hypothetical protein